MEIFKDIKSNPDYQISNLGRVWSKKSNRYMKLLRDTDGYLRVRLYMGNGKGRTEKVHRLVAIAFIDNPNGLPEVNHINHQRDDNRVDNLEWVSHDENMKKAKNVKKIAKYDRDGNLLAVYDSICQAAREENVNPSSIYCYINRKPQKNRKYLWSKII